MDRTPEIALAPIDHGVSCKPLISPLYSFSLCSIKGTPALTASSLKTHNTGTWLVAVAVVQRSILLAFPRSPQKHLDDDSPACVQDWSGSRTLRPSQRAGEREDSGCERWDLGAAHSCFVDRTVVLAVCSSWSLCESRRNVSLYIY